MAEDFRYSTVTVRVIHTGFKETIELYNEKALREQQITELFLKAIQTISSETSVQAEAFFRGNTTVKAATEFTPPFPLTH